jgi:hypothetical protein
MVARVVSAVEPFQSVGEFIISAPTHAVPPELFAIYKRFAVAPLPCTNANSPKVRPVGKVAPVERFIRIIAILEFSSV